MTDTGLPVRPPAYYGQLVAAALAPVVVLLLALLALALLWRRRRRRRRRRAADHTESQRPMLGSSQLLDDGLIRARQAGDSTLRVREGNGRDWCLCGGLVFL